MEQAKREKPGFELFYFANRARRELQLAEAASDIRASQAHRSLGMNYALRAMRLAVMDARSAGSKPA